MAKPQPKPWTLDEFLAWEQRQTDKFELVGGMVFAMAGGTAAHSRITANVLTALSAGLRGTGCEAYTSDMKIVADYFSAYPDVSVCCSPVADEAVTIHDPVLLVEVLSSSTRDRDLRMKFESYGEIPSLKYYMLIDQERCWVELRSRDEGEWRSHVCDALDEAIELPALGVTLAVSDIYARVTVRQRPARPS